MVALVYLPGLDGTGLLSTGLAAALQSTLEVIIAAYPRERTLDYAGAEIVARSFLPEGRPFLILGESYSGPIALSIAANPPPGLCGVILACSFVRNPLPWLRPARPLLGLVPVRALPLAALDMILLGRHSTAPLRVSLAESIATVRPAVLRARVRSVLSVDLSARVPGVGCPILYLRASEDRLIPRAASEGIAALIPDLRVVELEGPHMLLQASPDVAAGAIIRFTRESCPDCDLFARHPWEQTPQG